MTDDDIDAHRPPAYRGPERRAKPPEDPVAAAIWALKKDLDERHEENAGRNDNIQEQLKTQNEKLDALSRGFPNNDPEGHRRYHESEIKKNEAKAKKEEKRAEFYQAILAELLTKGIWAAIGFTALALWLAFKSKVMS